MQGTQVQASMTGKQLKTLGGVALCCLPLSMAGCSIDDRQFDVPPAQGAQANQVGADMPVAGAGSDERLGSTAGGADPGAESALPANRPVTGGQGAGASASSAADAGSPMPTPQVLLAKAAAEHVLIANCGACHGSQLTPQQAQAGLNYIGDIDQLVVLGLITPLDSAASRVIQRMVRGEMPPPTSGLPAVTPAAIDIVAQYIDKPAYWPGFPAPSACAPSSLVDFDALFQLINRDLAGVAARDAGFYRYLSLTNRALACGAGAALDPDRQALSKLLNMLSTSPTIFNPVAINADATVYRIDLRALAWDRPITVQGQTFKDVWEAIAGKDAYAVAWTGADADAAVASAQTKFPLLFADQMLAVAAVGELYYGIIGVDVNRSLPDFILNQLGVDIAQNLVAATSVRAGTTKSRVSGSDVLVERDSLEIRSGALWQNRSFPSDANPSMFTDPFLASGQGEDAAIFTLPNGMLAFVIADRDGVVVEASGEVLDTNQTNFQAITSVSCSSCHSSGFLSVVDEVRDSVVAASSAAASAALSAADLQRLQQIYLSPQDFAQRVQNDSATFYAKAMALANLPTQGADPVSSEYVRFNTDVTLAEAAGDLGLTPSDLQSNLDLLEPALTVLRNGALPRGDFTRLFVNSLCILAIVLDNQPDRATCDAAAAAR